MAVNDNPRQSGDGAVEVVVARVGKPHGIRGEVTVDVRTDSPERRFTPGARLRAVPAKGSASTLREVTVVKARWHQGTLLLTVAEVSDRTAAEALRGTVLHATIDPSESPEDPEEYYDHQLVGLLVRDLDGTELGHVTAVVHGAAQDLLSVRTPEGRDALVPFVSALVPQVDLDSGHVVVADRPGLVAPHPED